MKKFVCCICNKTIKDEYGNDPRPYKQSGQCCFHCNNLFVIPMRIRLARQGGTK